MSDKNIIEPIEPSELRDLVMSMYDIQHARIIIGNRLGITKDHVGIKFYNSLWESERMIKNHIEKEVKHFPIHIWLVKRKGIKEDMAAQMIGMLQDISKFDNISSLHSYCGYGVIKICNTCNKKYIEPEDRPEWIAHVAARLKEQFDKKKGRKGAPPDFVDNATKMLCAHDNPETRDVAQRKVKGTLLDYNPKLKSLVWRYSGQFVKQGKRDIYRPLYEEFKEKYRLREDLKSEIDEKEGGQTKFGETKGTAHIDNMAKRKMVKIFLGHLWSVWRELEGLPVSEPWIIGVGGHSKYIPAPGPTVEEIPALMEKARLKTIREEKRALEKLNNPKKTPLAERPNSSKKKEASKDINTLMLLDADDTGEDDDLLIEEMMG